MDDINNRHIAWITFWAFIGVVVMTLGTVLGNAAAKPHLGWLWTLVIICGVVLIVAIYAAVSPLIHWWPFPKSVTESDDAEIQESYGECQLKALYAAFLQEGDACIRQLEGVLEQITLPGWSEKQLNELVKFEDTYIERCLTWIAQTRYDIAFGVNETSAVRFTTHPYTRLKPSYVENELGVWRSMAGCLDWLISELSK
jgi:hypothetical protein